MSSYIETVVSELKDKIVQVYFGDTHEQIHYTDSTSTIPSVMIGKIIGGSDGCLILSCPYLDEEQNVRFGNVQYINSFNIKSITEVDGRGTIKDALISAHAVKYLEYTK